MDDLVWQTPALEAAGLDQAESLWCLARVCTLTAVDLSKWLPKVLQCWLKRRDPHVVAVMAAERGVAWAIRLLAGGGVDMLGPVRSSVHSPLDAALSHGHAAVLRSIAAAGVNLSAEVEVSHGSLATVAAYYGRDVELRCLAAAGADVAAADRSKWT